MADRARRCRYPGDMTAEGDITSEQPPDADEGPGAEGGAPAAGDGGLFDRLRHELTDERSQIGSQLGELGHDEDSLAFDENFADSAQVAAEQGENRALAAQLREQLDDIDAALRRLDDGTYGRCEVCGVDIGEARLDAMPATRWCIEHAGG
ncbi:MAG: TraR/DksA C4-type zinc finger protein [Acidimicrobiia bacterium]|nr:TraR/DksA C4-type zinc finger protein [Acidimicrobiia bacterium]